MEFLNNYLYILNSLNSMFTSNEYVGDICIKDEIAKVAEELKIIKQKENSNSKEIPNTDKNTQIFSNWAIIHDWIKENINCSVKITIPIKNTNCNLIVSKKEIYIHTSSINKSNNCLSTERFIFKTYCEVQKINVEYKSTYLDFSKLNIISDNVYQKIFIISTLIELIYQWQSIKKELLSYQEKENSIYNFKV